MDCSDLLAEMPKIKCDVGSGLVRNRAQQLEQHFVQRIEQSANDKENSEQCDSIPIELMWCGPEPKDNLKEFIDEKLRHKALVSEIEQLYRDIEYLDNELNNENTPNDSSEKDIPYLDTAPLKKCLDCIAMRRIYPELLDKSDGCICKSHCDVLEGNKNCICQPENFALISHTPFPHVSGCLRIPNFRKWLSLPSLAIPCVRRISQVHPKLPCVEEVPTERKKSHARSASVDLDLISKIRNKFLHVGRGKIRNSTETQSTV